MTSKLEEAIALATSLHAGQVDKGGAAYIGHPIRLMNLVTGEARKMVAVLHDMVEDCGITIAEIQAQFGDEVADAVECLTKRRGESYDDFIARCSGNPIARNVKLADLTDNMDATRLPCLTDKDRERLEKYRRAFEVLSA